MLLVEHEKGIRELLRQHLQNKGYAVTTAVGCVLAEQLWNVSPPDIAIVDCILPDGDALQQIARFKALDPSVRILVLTGYGSLDRAVEAVKLGAEQFLPKPVDLLALSIAMERALDDQRNRRNQLAHMSNVKGILPNLFLGESDAIRTLADSARFAASEPSSVLIEGEIGTGKQWLGEWLHRHGPRPCEPFVAVNCGGFSDSELESKLFGSEDGDEREDKAGFLELAHRGTLFLSHLDRANLQVQSRLLRVLERDQASRPGERSSVDVRLIAATRQSIPQLVREGRFRGDLYFHLSRKRLTIPPVRKRVEDIAVLAEEIVDGLAAEMGKPRFELTREALRALEDHSWPGNLRELRNVLERAVLTNGSGILTPAHLHFKAQMEADPAGNASPRTLEDLKRKYIEQVFREEGGRVDAAARKLAIPRSSLYHKLKQYNIDRFAARPPRDLRALP